MEHIITLTRTHSDLRGVADGLHLRCSCGWSASAHDEPTAVAIAEQHRIVGVPAPVPASPSPN